MTNKHKRVFTFALVVCLLFGLLPGSSRAEEAQALPVADAPAAETPPEAVPATQTPTELTEAETVSLSEDGVPGDPFNRDCIYGENKDHPYVANNLIICEGCRNAIQDAASASS